MMFLKLYYIINGHLNVTVIMFNANFLMICNASRLVRLTIQFLQYKHDYHCYEINCLSC